MKKLINIVVLPIAIVSGMIAVTAVINYLALPVFTIAVSTLIANNRG